MSYAISDVSVTSIQHQHDATVAGRRHGQAFINSVVCVRRAATSQTVSVLHDSTVKSNRGMPLPAATTIMEDVDE